MKTSIVFAIAALAIVMFPASGATLHDASLAGDIEQAKTLAAAGADVNAPNAEGLTPLHEAAIHGHAGVVEALVAAGADVNAPNAKGGTPLHEAAIHGHADVVEALAAAGADVNTSNAKGFTLLHEAAIHGHAGVVGALAAAGADVNAPNAKGGTPLHEAAAQGHAGVVEVLAAAGADVNARTAHGITPLHLAIFQDDAGVVEALVAAGADVNAQAADGVTPLELARTKGHAAVIAALEAAGYRAEILAEVVSPCMRFIASRILGLEDPPQETFDLLAQEQKQDIEQMVQTVSKLVEGRSRSARTKYYDGAREACQRPVARLTDKPREELVKLALEGRYELLVDLPYEPYETWSSAFSGTLRRGTAFRVTGYAAVMGENIYMVSVEGARPLEALLRRSDITPGTVRELAPP